MMISASDGEVKRSGSRSRPALPTVSAAGARTTGNCRVQRRGAPLYELAVVGLILVTIN